MYQTAELVVKSYKPLFLEKGMLFITKLNPNTRKEYVELWKLEEVPQNTEEFLITNGYPVELNIVVGDQIVAEHHQIGWFDAGEDTDELYDITLKELNHILAEWDGELEIEVDDEEKPFIYMDKITMRYPTIEFEEDYITDLEVWTNGKKLGSERIEMDGVHLIEHCVEYDDRLWGVVTDLDHELQFPFAEAVLHADDDSELDPDGDDWDDMDDDTWKEI